MMQPMPAAAAPAHSHASQRARLSTLSAQRPRTLSEATRRGRAGARV
jgi:hypothetical protein